MPRAAERGPSPALPELERTRALYGAGPAARKLALLRSLEAARLPRAQDVLHLHEILCFLRAYPDGRAVLRQVERMLRRFSRRSDLRRHRDALADSGIAGTEIRFPFFWFTARWLARRWPERLFVDWRAFARKQSLEGLLPLLLPYCESTALDEWTASPEEWVHRLAGPRETDAAFLIRRFDRVAAGAFVKEKLYEDLDPPLRLAPGPDRPSRTGARYLPSRVFFQRAPLDRSRPDLAREIRRAPLRVRTVSPAQGRALIDLAREAMITRSRDLNVFEHADPRDVRLVDFGEGLEFACLGATPERRLMLESVYGFLTLRNGVPIGYVLTSALLGSSEIAYNVFESFRGAEAARVFARVLAMTRALFGSDSFTIGADQLGHENEEGLRSGAWWFYYKLGFRPLAPAVRRVAAIERARMRREPRHRSSLATLRRLASENLFYFLGRPRRDVLGRLSLGNIGLRVSSALAARGGADREAAVRASAEEAARLLGVSARRTTSGGERLAWERWGPLVAMLPGIERWSAAERRALAAIVRAKWGRRESDFVLLANRHRKLGAALTRLARSS